MLIATTKRKKMDFLCPGQSRPCLKVELLECNYGYYYVRLIITCPNRMHSGKSTDVGINTVSQSIFLLNIKKYPSPSHCSIDTTKYGCRIQYRSDNEAEEN